MSERTRGSDYVREILGWATSNWKYSSQETPQIWKELGEFWSAQISAAFVLSQEMPNDPIRILALEVQADLEASILLAVSGFYRHATLILRSWLGISFASVWFSFNRTQFDQWMKGDQMAPFRYRGVMNHLLLKELLTKTASLEKAEERFHLVERGMQLHQELSDFVHARGRKAMDISHRNDSVPHYYPNELNAWFEQFRDIFEIWVVLVFTRYPHLLMMDRYSEEKKQIMTRLSSETRAKLEELKQ